MFPVVVHRCCRQQLVRHLLPVCRLPVQRFSTTIDDVWSKLKFLPMPQLSPTMHTGTIEQWHMRPGDVAEQYRLCVEVSATTLLKESDSTEKIHMEVEIMEDMHLAALLHRPGDTVDVGTPVAVFCDDEATVNQLRSLNVSENRAVSCVQLPLTLPLSCVLFFADGRRRGAVPRRRRRTVRPVARLRQGGRQRPNRFRLRLFVVA